MDLKIGDSFAKSRLVTDELIRAFAELSGDFNPIHLDEDFAARTRFGKRIAHGMLSASLISAVLAKKLPGAGSIYLGQTLQFVAPVFPGDAITARVTVKEIRPDKPIMKLETVCINQRDEVVIRGEATVLSRG